jgi:hypothetical protein
MRNLLFLTLILPFSSYALEDIFSKMDEKTAVTTGIYKLSLAEKTALLNWLQSSQEVSREKIKQEVRAEVKEEVKKEVVAEEVKKEKKRFMGFKREESEREPIKTNIIGEFNGWRGKNIFKLANGQVWKQSEKSSFYIPKRTNPAVTIKPKSMGSWQLYVDGFGRGVKVKRIK